MGALLLLLCVQASRSSAAPRSSCLFRELPCEERLPLPTKFPDINLPELVADYKIKPKRVPFRVVVSMTTFPGRHDCGRAIDGLLRQSYKPDAIMVSIPKHLARMAPAGYETQAVKRAQNITSRWSEDLVVANLLDKDYGPATKLLGALEGGNLEPSSLVITGVYKRTVLGL